MVSEATHRVTRAKYAAKTLRVAETDLGAERAGRVAAGGGAAVHGAARADRGLQGRVKGQQRELVLLSELMPGGSLNHWLYRHKHKYDAASKKQLALDIAEGLAFLHSRGIVHRDLKSDNILVSEDGRRAKVADLGFAKRKDEGKSYMSVRGCERRDLAHLLLHRRTLDSDVHGARDASEREEVRRVGGRVLVLAGGVRAAHLTATLPQQLSLPR